MLRKRLAVGSTICLLAALAPNAPAIAQPSQAPEPAPFDRVGVYTGSVPINLFTELRKLGLDREDLKVVKGGQEAVTVEAILSGRQAKTLRSKGIDLKIKTIRGVPATERLRQKALAGQTVFRSYSQPGGLHDELVKTAQDHPSLTKLVNLGQTVQGKPITGIKVTTQARWLPDGLRPSTIYIGAQHAREWITPEMVRRLMHHVIDNYGRDPEITRLLRTSELWFVPVANPDGYDFTFTEHNRLWRKTLRDNNGDGQIKVGDGVDLNRNYAYKWGFDDEGSSPDPANNAYRGSGPNSEPETQALDALFQRVGFDFLINYHSAASLLLYGVGWQVSTPTPDDVIYETLAGDDAHPAVPGSDPDIAAELYTTNGDTDGHVADRYGTLGFTPEMSTCETASDYDPDDRWLPEECESVYSFPDDERLIQHEFAKNVPFALSVAKSAKDPANPVSSVGRSAPEFVIDKFDVSYGASSQQVAAIARRSLVAQRLHYSINGGPTRTTGVAEWKGGRRYGDTNNDFYAEMRGTVTGASAGDSVKVWFTAMNPGSGPVSSESFTYRVHDDVGGQVLVLAVEDVTGISPVQGVPNAKYAGQITASLSAAGYSTDVYDFDVMGRKAPHHLGVLSHYRAVVWETGDDFIHRAVGQVPGTAAKSAVDIELSVRDYLNEGGKLLVSGQNALFAQSQNSFTYNPFGPPECTTPGDYPCLPMLDDFLQYWLGAYVYRSNGGTDPEGEPFPLTGTAGHFNGFQGTINGPGSAANQTHTAAFVATPSFLPPSRFPQFGGASAVDWAHPGIGPFDPYNGDWYIYSGQFDISYKRLTRTLDLTGAGSGKLNFFTSYDTEINWDYLFVEAHEVGTDGWTTLPDANGHTQTGTGDSCPEGWNELHPHLDHYQGADCSPAGTTGTWNAASGSSGGWQEWAIDLTAYAGKRVEVSISYASDWSNQGLGVFLDDARVTVDGAVVAETSFEDGLGGWTLAGPPPGSENNVSFTRSQVALDEGAVVVTADTVFTGFGLEGLDPAARHDFVARAMLHLLG
jgi:hypothetical protein